MPHPTRDIITGGMGKMLSVADTFPRLADKYMERTTFDGQKTDKPMGDRPNNLYEPVEHDGGERSSNWEGRTKSTSLYTTAALHPRATAMVAAACAGLIAAALLARRGRERSRSQPYPSSAGGITGFGARSTAEGAIAAEQATFPDHETLSMP